jgi:hypothetical protein
VDSLGTTQTVGWILTIAGLAISVYTAVTGNWLPIPSRLRPKNIPVTVHGRRLSAFGGIALFVALGIEQSLISRQLPTPVKTSVLLAVFALIITSIVLVLMAWRTTR